MQTIIGKDEEKNFCSAADGKKKKMKKKEEEVEKEVEREVEEK